MRKKVLLIGLVVALLACQGCESNPRVRQEMEEDYCRKNCWEADCEFSHFVYGPVGPECWCIAPNGEKAQLW